MAVEALVVLIAVRLLVARTSQPILILAQRETQVTLMDQLMVARILVRPMGEPITTLQVGIPTDIIMEELIITLLVGIPTVIIIPMEEPMAELIIIATQQVLELITITLPMAKLTIRPKALLITHQTIITKMDNKVAEWEQEGS